MNQLQKNRYPGIKPFRLDDHPLFQGRDQEIQDLFYLVKAKRLAVLFGKSGIGKTSLLYAGVFRLFQQAKIFPLVIRFQNNNSSPLNIIIKELEPHVNQDLLKAHTNYMMEETTLWQYVNACEFDKKGYTLLLIFDQFEEYFIHSKNKRKPCTAEIADLINERLPNNIQRQLRSIPRKERTAEQLNWFQPLNTKLLFLIRSDKLSLMDEMTAEMNAILKTRFHLLPLQREEAKKAITKPANLNDPTLSTKPFSFQTETEKEILDNLCNKDDEVECFQLQVLCQHIEREVRLKQEKGQSDIVVTPDYLGGSIGIEKILNNYYEDQILLIRVKKDQSKARKLIEEGLIIDGRRIGVDEAFLIKNYKISESLLLQLLASRLIQVENTRFGKSYEVSHDSLVSPILKSYEKRSLQEKKSRFTIRLGLMLGVLFTIILGALFFGYYQYTGKNQLKAKNQELKKQTVDLWKKEAEKSKQEGDNVSALINLSRALEYGTDSTNIYRQITQLNQEKIVGQFEPAEFKKEETRKIFKDLNNSYFQMAINGMPEHYEKIDRNYELILKRNPDNYEALWNYALFLEQQNEPQRAILYYSRAERNAPDKLNQVKCLNQYGHLLVKMKIDTTAYIIRKAYNISIKMKKKHPLTYIESINIMAEHNKERSRDLAELYYAAAIKNLNGLDINSSVNFPMLIMTYNGLGDYRTKQKSFNLAKDYLLQSLKMSKVLAKQDPKSFLPTEATTLLLLGDLFLEKTELANAEKYYLEALAIYSKLAQQNPPAYDLYLGLNKLKLSKVYKQKSARNKGNNELKLKFQQNLNEGSVFLRRYEGKGIPVVEENLKMISVD